MDTDEVFDYLLYRKQRMEKMNQSNTDSARWSWDDTPEGVMLKFFAVHHIYDQVEARMYKGDENFNVFLENSLTCLKHAYNDAKFCFDYRTEQMPARTRTLITYLIGAWRLLTEIWVALQAGDSPNLDWRRIRDQMCEYNQKFRVIEGYEGGLLSIDVENSNDSRQPTEQIDPAENPEALAQESNMQEVNLEDVKSQVESQEVEETKHIDGSGNGSGNGSGEGSGESSGEGVRLPCNSSDQSKTSSKGPQTEIEPSDPNSGVDEQDQNIEPEQEKGDGESGSKQDD